MNEIKELLLLVLEGQKALFRGLYEQRFSADEARKDWKRWEERYNNLLSEADEEESLSDHCVSCKVLLTPQSYYAAKDGPFCKGCMFPMGGP